MKITQIIESFFLVSLYSIAFSVAYLLLVIVGSDNTPNTPETSVIYENIVIPQEKVEILDVPFHYIVLFSCILVSSIHLLEPNDDLTATERCLFNTKNSLIPYNQENYSLITNDPDYRLTKNDVYCIKCKNVKTKWMFLKNSPYYFLIGRQLKRCKAYSSDQKTIQFGRRHVPEPPLFQFDGPIITFEDFKGLL